jgi:hypothetical protein
MTELSEEEKEVLEFLKSRDEQTTLAEITARFGTIKAIRITTELSTKNIITIKKIREQTIFVIHNP